MAQRVVLHIGTMKSGTTFIQQTLRTNQEVLREHGVLFPGGKFSAQVAAVQDLVGSLRAGAQPLQADGPWLRLVEEIRQWPGTAVVSMEYLGPRGRRAIALATEAFGDARVDVVLTLRDLGRAVPAMWTESVQNRGTLPWTDYLDAVRSVDDEDRDERPEAIVAGRRAFWRQQHAPAIVRRWIARVGTEHFTLITVPPPGAPPEVLWSRFAQVLGVAPELCELPATHNPSPDAASALVLRALNERLAAAGLGRADYEHIVKRRLAKEGLARRAAPGARVGFSARWLRRKAEGEVAALAALDLQVIGDLDELRAHGVRGVDPTKVDAREQLEAALDGLTAVILAWAAERDCAR